MDVVLDSLAGDFVDASLRLVALGGVFLEMGKIDIRDPDVIAQAYPGVRYRAFDLSEPGRSRMHQYMLELAALFDAGVLRPLPVKTFDVRRAPAALRYLSQARHVGKVVIDDAGCVGGRHRIDHWWYRNGRFGVGSSRGGPPWGT